MREHLINCIIQHIRLADRFMELSKMPALFDKWEAFKQEAKFHLEHAGILNARMIKL